MAGPAVSSSQRFRFRSVAVQPGHSALTRMPWAAHSTASDLVSEIRPALAAPYGARKGAALDAGHRGDVDDRAAAPLHQMRADGVAHVHGRVEVQPDELVPAGQPEVQERHHEAGPARVVHHDVHVAKLVDRPGDRRRHRLLLGDVSGNDERLPAQRGDLRGGLSQPILTPGHQGQVRPGSGQGDRDRLPYPPRGPGNECLLASQVEERHAQSFHSVGSGAAAGFTRRTISFSTIRT